MFDKFLDWTVRGPYWDENCAGCMQCQKNMDGYRKIYFKSVPCGDLFLDIFLCIRNNELTNVVTRYGKNITNYFHITSGDKFQKLNSSRGWTENSEVFWILTQAKEEYERSHS